MKWFLLLALFLTASTVADEKSVVKKDFKCFVDTSVDKRIVFYRWDVNKAESKMRSLPAKRVQSSIRSNRAYIKEAIECVELKKEFHNAEARKLDKITPR